MLLTICECRKKGASCPASVDGFLVSTSINICMYSYHKSHDLCNSREKRLGVQLQLISLSDCTSISTCMYRCHKGHDLCDSREKRLGVQLQARLRHALMRLNGPPGHRSAHPSRPRPHDHVLSVGGCNCQRCARCKLKPSDVCYQAVAKLSEMRAPI